MSAIERFIAYAKATLPRRLKSSGPRHVAVMAISVALGAAGMALAQDEGASSLRVSALLAARLPKTQITRVDCRKLASFCEVTAGSNLFYVDQGARFLVIGRVYDMETRQDLTAARLLEINPDLLVGGAVSANAAASSPPPETELAAATPGLRETDMRKAVNLSLDGLPKDGAIIWGKSGGPTLTVFSDFRCGYCRALSNVLRQMDVQVVERPISVLGSRDIAERVYCAPNRQEALHAAYAGEPLPGAAKCDTSGLDANEAFAKRHGLMGTPVIVRSDGAMLEGYRPKEFLLAWLKEARS